MPSVSEMELNTAIAQLRGYDLADSALTMLDHHQGDLEAALAASIAQEYGGAAMGEVRSLKEATLTVLRRELCGDEGFRGLVKGYVSKSQNATLLTGAIAYILESVTLPFSISPAIATLVVLYVLKVGLDIFCEYTQPDFS